MCNGWKRFPVLQGTDFVPSPQWNASIGATGLHITLSDGLELMLSLVVISDSVSPRLSCRLGCFTSGVAGLKLAHFCGLDIFSFPR
jgi:hypothetical protein